MHYLRLTQLKLELYINTILFILKLNISITLVKLEVERKSFSSST